jgi:hypothetical protein
MAACLQAGVWREGKLVGELEEWQCALAVEGANEAAAVARRVQVGGGGLAEAAQQLLADPPTWAYAVAAALALTGQQLTPTLDLVSSQLATAHGPLALLALGLTLELAPPQQRQVGRLSSAGWRCSACTHCAALCCTHTHTCTHARIPTLTAPLSPVITICNWRAYFCGADAAKRLPSLPAGPPPPPLLAPPSLPFPPHSTPTLPAAAPALLPCPTPHPPPFTSPPPTSPPLQACRATGRRIAAWPLGDQFL